jgi:beta-phosphoglucomutase-like phosphatase (HAD superfamily)
VSSEAFASPRAVLLSLDDVVLPRQTLARWQWAWRPQGPLLAERHVRSAIRHSVQAWDRQRWDQLVQPVPAPPAPGGYRAFLMATLQAIAGHPLAETEANAVVDRFPRFPDEAGPFPDVVPFLERLQRAGIAYAVIADRPVEELHEAIRRAGLAPLITQVAGGEAGAPPPSPDAFRAAARALRARPTETVVVGSLFWSEYRAGRRAGLGSLLIDRYGWWDRVQAARQPSLAALPGGFPAAFRPLATADAETGA